MTAKVSLLHGSMVHLFCERLLKKPRLEGPLSTGGSESQGRRNHEIQGPADRPRQDTGRQQPSNVSRRAPRRHWYHYIRRQWPKRRAQDIRAPPPTDSWAQRGHSYQSPGLYQTPFCVSQEPRAPIRDFLTFGCSVQMNLQRLEPGFRRPVLQEPGTGFTQPMQIPPPLVEQEHRRPMPPYPARPWQQQEPVAAAQIPLHLCCLRQNGARTVPRQHQNHMLQGWRWTRTLLQNSTDILSYITYSYLNSWLKTRAFCLIWEVGQKIRTIWPIHSNIRFKLRSHT